MSAVEISQQVPDDVSYMCMEDPGAVFGRATIAHVVDDEEKIDNIAQLKQALDTSYAKGLDRTQMHEKLLQILRRVDLSTNELNKYTFWDSEKSYTRNLVATDDRHYTLLLLCWNPGKESKVHNHPCDGCYVKTVRGCIRESQYGVRENQEVYPTKVRFFNEGQISYIDDSMGLHKIGNPFRDSGSVSLHLYTPPFSSCKVRKNVFNIVHDIINFIVL
jgi:predicted metal-dependent enzyme (double-stranded beta helix superfamily)